METTNDRLNHLRGVLADIVGRDLADSLVRAGRKRGEFDLDMQLAINDGLQGLPQDKRLEALAMIDGLMGRN
ncbi:hypothetical protein HH303_18660 [Rhodospirillaceae bacterium KN72]|uniref:Uncharacterized protein n=1 Tax=Pacificispira spongiicola TaxID=2729598 RepID=A0A7Y0E3F1_9PROT|nr:hypothetical protein [Pacificispira spongiicola]NMM46519.1 hypothetical protein [Pacificispira spongiicola]